MRGRGGLSIGEGVYIEVGDDCGERCLFDEGVGEVGEGGTDDDGSAAAGIGRARACRSDWGREAAPVLMWRSARASGLSCTSLANSTRNGEMVVSGR